MAMDLIVRTDEGIATLVHDEPGLTIETVVVAHDGLYSRSPDGEFLISRGTAPIFLDLDKCVRCLVVEMDGWRVKRTSEARLIKEVH